LADLHKVCPYIVGARLAGFGAQLLQPLVVLGSPTRLYQFPNFLDYTVQHIARKNPVEPIDEVLARVCIWHVAHCFALGDHCLQQA
jgi:hypothetical protein